MKITIEVVEGAQPSCDELDVALNYIRDMAQGMTPDVLGQMEFGMAYIPAKLRNAIPVDIQPMNPCWHCYDTLPYSEAGMGVGYENWLAVWEGTDDSTAYWDSEAWLFDQEQHKNAQG